MFTHYNRIEQVSTVAAGAAASTALTSSVVDTAGYDGVLFVVPFGPIVTGAVTSIKAQQDTVVGMGSAADIAGSNQTVADDADNRTFVIDIKRPRERFVQCVVSRATQNATVGAITAILYNSTLTPVSHGSTVAVESFVSPAEGTA